VRDLPPRVVAQQAHLAQRLVDLHAVGEVGILEPSRGVDGWRECYGGEGAPHVSTQCARTGFLAVEGELVHDSCILSRSISVVCNDGGSLESYVHDLGEGVDDLVSFDVLIEVNVLAIVYMVTMLKTLYDIN
jgi:hypothetical protein